MEAVKTEVVESVSRSVKGGQAGCNKRQVGCIGKCAGRLGRGEDGSLTTLFPNFFISKSYRLSKSIKDIVVDKVSVKYVLS